MLLLSGAPGALAVGLVLAALPVAPLIGVYMWLDRYEPEPRSLLLLGLGWGAFVATSVALLLQLVDTPVFSSDDVFPATVVAPVTEEATKGLFILLLLFFRRHELDGVLDGLVYAGMVGIGFAFTENILYLTAAYVGEDGQAGGLGGAVGLFVVRGIFSPFAHPFFTSFIGIGVGLAVASRSWAVRVLAPLVGYLVAVPAHAAWNGSLMLDDGRNAFATYFFLMVPAFLLLTGFAVWSRRREGRVLTAALSDCAQRGFLDPAEIPWLARIPARRFARRYAERAGGQPARRVMVAYQNEAVELGFLHSRYLRGVAPPDFAAVGQSHVERMRALRPDLLWPQASGSPGGCQRSRASRGPGTGVTNPGDARDGPADLLGPARRSTPDADHARAPARGAASMPACPSRSPAWRSTAPAAPRWSTSSRTTCCPGCARSTRRCSPWSAARPAPASRRWSTPSSASGSPSRACCARPRARRCSCTTPTTPTGSTRRGSCPSSSAPPAPRPTPARSSWWRPPRSRRAWRCWTPPTSTPSRSATAPWPPSCWRPPTCGCSSPPPRATPTRCRGTSSSRPPSAAPPSRSCSTAPRPRRSPRSATTSPGC